MLEELKKEVYEANMLLPKYQLVTFTWGNVSGIDREKGLFVIKPSGVDYDKLRPEDMVVVDLNGNKVEGDYNPSSDTETHVVLYNRFPKIGGIVHTHSPWATSWAQAGRGIPCYGTTHADYLYGEVPCVRNLTEKEINEAYEKNTGVLIADEFDRPGLDYIATPAVLCKNHGPFTWGKDAHEAVHNAVVLEEVAKMAARCELINPKVQPAPQELQDKHYFRKEITTIVDGPISGEVKATTVDAEGMIKEGREIAAIHPNMVVKIPMTVEGLKAVKVLSAEGIKTNVTLIFTANQALLAARAGATYVSPFLGRLDDISTAGISLIEDIVTIFDNYGLETEIIAASIRHPMHVTDCALAGAHIATVPYKVIEQMTHHPLTDQGIAKFQADYKAVFGE